MSGRSEKVKLQLYGGLEMLMILLLLMLELLSQLQGNSETKSNNKVDLLNMNNNLHCLLQISSLIIKYVTRKA